MIAKLSGILDSAGQDSLILDVAGVGYQVFASGRTLSRAGLEGDPLSLLIDTHVREDHIHLYGFVDAAEQQWFRLLTTVQGVGARAALAILSACPPDQLGFAIASGDAVALRRADGVGPKLATRIVTELKDKAGKIDLGMQPKGVRMASAAPAPSVANLDQDAVSALINLGYGRSEAYAAVAQVKQKHEDADISTLIRFALKELTQ